MQLSDRTQVRDREVRTFDVELRAASEGRTIEGLAAPFNAPATIRDAFGEYEETILPGAFKRTISERAGKIKLLASHNRQAFPLANIESLSEAADGLRMAASMPNTTAGNDALTLVRDGIASGLSIGFQVAAGGQKWNDDYTARSISEIKLMEISLVAEPAYAEAGVTGVRDIDGEDPEALADALEALRAGDATEDQIALVTRAHTSFGEALASLVNDPEPEVPQSIREAMADLYNKKPIAA
jgi:HK97 family phage prohead protease